MTAVLPRPNPFADATCRQPDRLQRWWDEDARLDERKVAAALCKQCPALTACRGAAAALGDSASGTWAGVYRPWAAGNTDDDALDEFTRIFGPSSASADNPPPTVTQQAAKPTRYGRHWIHPAQLHIEYREAN